MDRLPTQEVRGSEWRTQYQELEVLCDSAETIGVYSHPDYGVPITNLAL